MADFSEQVDVLRYRVSTDESVHKAVAAGDGTDIVDMHNQHANTRRQLTVGIGGGVCAIAAAGGWQIDAPLISVGIIVAGLGIIAKTYRSEDHLPELVAERVSAEQAKQKYDAELHG